jgi:hypothetical protein
MSQEPKPSQEPEEGGYVGEWTTLPIGSDEDPRMKELRESVKEARNHPTLEYWKSKAQAIGHAIYDALNARGRE